MNKIVTFAVVAGGALALAACGAKKEEAPADPVEAEMMMPEGETPAATDAAAEAEAAAEGVDPTGNPIGPGAQAPAAGAAPAEPAAPAE